MSFRDLERADQLIADAAKYRAWKARDSESRQTLYETLNVDRFTYDRVTGFIAPFGIAGRNLFISANIPADAQNRPTGDVRGLLVGYFEANAPAGSGDTILESSQSYFPVNKLAKLTLKLRVGTATERSPSRITGRRYYRHRTNSASMVFGKKAATDTYESAVRDIKNDAAYKTFNDVKGNSIIFTPEG